MKDAGSAMVGQVPGTFAPPRPPPPPHTFCTVQKLKLLAYQGLIKFDCAPPLPSTASRAKGYDLGLVAVLEKPEDVSVYAAHPAHLK